jgi:hypothetical protein
MSSEHVDDIALYGAFTAGLSLRVKEWPSVAIRFWYEK